MRALGISIALVAAYVVFVAAVDEVPLGTLFGAMALPIIGGLSLWLISILVVAADGIARALISQETHERPLDRLKIAMRRRWADDFGLSSLWPPLLWGILIGVFGVFKQTVLRRIGFHDDKLFADLDRALFFGTDPWRISHSLPSPWTTLFLDRQYHVWALPMFYSVVACGFFRGAFEYRLRYMLAYTLCWILIASLLAYLLPAAGPCFEGVLFRDPGSFHQFMNTLGAEQADLARRYPGFHLKTFEVRDYLLSLNQTNRIGPGGGISAMPSMHVALSALFACAGFGLGKIWGWIATVFGVLIFVGSVHLGWHYAIDGIVGAAAAVGIWYGCGWVVPRLIRRLA
ncbi:MAG TPA: phosphatase PAP2 family protein [Caulobacteraceae bacterium]|nr:phosphatase PAP2 family protein [Caulobacteraceae bacterium]